MPLSKPCLEWGLKTLLLQAICLPILGSLGIKFGPPRLPQKRTSACCCWGDVACLCRPLVSKAFIFWASRGVTLALVVLDVTKEGLRGSFTRKPAFNTSHCELNLEAIGTSAPAAHLWILRDRSCPVLTYSACCRKFTLRDTSNWKTLLIR